MRGDVDVPALRAEKAKIGDGRFRPRQKHHVTVCGKRLPRLEKCQTHIRLTGQRVEIVEIRNPAQHRHRDMNRRIITGVSRLAGDVENILGGQEPGRGEPWQNPKAGPTGCRFDHCHAIGKERGVATKLVDQEAADQRPVRRIKHRTGANKASDDAAAVDVAGDHNRNVNGSGESHIGDVAGAKIDLGRASRPLDNHQIGITPDHLETIEDSRQQFGLVSAIFTGTHAAETLSLDNDLRAGLAFRLQQHRVHVDACRGAAGQRLHGLGPADLAAIQRHGGVVRHILRLERAYRQTGIGEMTAQAGDKHRFADIRAGPLDHDAGRRHAGQPQNSTPICALIPDLKGCLTRLISVTRSAASINASAALRPVSTTCVISGFSSRRKPSTSSRSI